MRAKFISLLGLSLLTLVASAPTLRLNAQEPQKEGPPEPTVKVGDIAPDFELTDQNGKKVALHDFKGKKQVVLAFYIFAFTDG
jgi:cytochrome oxidase Cu insertion factor (SCO1/SenC/PrrC family)